MQTFLHNYSFGRGKEQIVNGNSHALVNSKEAANQSMCAAKDSTVDGWTISRCIKCHSTRDTPQGKTLFFTTSRGDPSGANLPARHRTRDADPAN